MSSILRILYHISIVISVLSTIISCSPLYMVRRVPSYLESIENLGQMIGEEQRRREEESLIPSILRRNRKSIPDGYFAEFTVNEPIGRERRGQPIHDYTDEFSADPFEVSFASLNNSR